MSKTQVKPKRKGKKLAEEVNKAEKAFKLLMSLKEKLKEEFKALMAPKDAP